MIPIKKSVSPYVDQNNIGKLLTIGEQIVSQIVKDNKLNKIESGNGIHFVDGTVILAGTSFGQHFIQIFTDEEFFLSATRNKKKECFCSCGVSAGFIANSIYKDGTDIDISGKDTSYLAMICQEEPPGKDFLPFGHANGTDFFRHTIGDESLPDTLFCICEIVTETSNGTKIEIKLQDITPCAHSKFRAMSIISPEHTEEFSEEYL